MSAESQSTNTAGEKATAAARVLIVDDESGFRDLLTYELGSQGHEVLSAANGSEAIRIFREGKIDLVITDLSMPQQGGMAVLSAVKEIDPKAEVILVTGYATLQDAVQSMKLGAYDFITKPFQIEDLLRLTERALEKRRLSLQVDELKEINRFKSEFLANMSHELRTPMNAILGYTSLQLDRVYGEIQPKQEEALKRVETAGRNLLQLINGILDLSKVTAGRMPVYQENFLLGELTKEVDGIMECLVQAKGITLKWDIAENLRIRTDKTKLKQILINLITNGVKFTREGGVFVEARVAPVGSGLALRVRDTGIGIKSEDLPSLFEEFKQLDASSTREFGGTGLGLAISRKFAELLGGSITAQSVHGQGSTFIVTLPDTNPDAAAAPPEPISPEQANGSKLLLAIDDDPEVLNLLRDNLHETGYAFTGALTGEEGLALARKLRPFAITLDIMMPHRDGWSILQALKSDPDLRNIPVIMVSILDNKSLGYSLGVSEYIVKPFERRELLDKLRGVDQGSSSKQTAGSGAAPSILIMDDESSIVEFLTETLRPEGFHVESAHDGREGLAKLAANRPDILFLDLMMPNMSGFEVIESIQREVELKKIRIIVLTAKHLTDDESCYLKERAELVIQKGSKSLREILAIVKGRLTELEAVG